MTTTSAALAPARPRAPRPAQSPAKASPAVTVTVADQSDASRRDAFVRRSAGATAFHLSHWHDAISASFGHRIFDLVAERDGQIVGLLPLCEIRSPLTGRALISCAFAVEGGPIADDPDVREALCAHAEELMHERRCTRLETRCPPPERDGWHAVSGLHYGFARDLEPDPEANLARVRRKQRAMVRKAIKLGLEARIERDPSVFHQLYAQSYLRLGTPVPAKRYIQALLDSFADEADILTVYNEGSPVASVLSLYFNGICLPYYSGASAQARDVAGNDFMYYALMRHAVSERGCHRFDFGRSKAGSGPFDFKRHWGFEPKPLTYAVYAPDGVPPAPANPANGRFAQAVRLWQRLPLPVSKALGRYLFPHFG